MDSNGKLDEKDWGGGGGGGGGVVWFFPVPAYLVMP